MIMYRYIFKLNCLSLKPLINNKQLVFGTKFIKNASIFSQQRIGVDLYSRNKLLNSINCHKLNAKLFSQSSIDFKNAVKLSEDINIEAKFQTLHSKKRPLRKKLITRDTQSKGLPVMAFSTAEEYNIETLIEAINLQGLYELTVSDTNDIEDAIHLTAKYIIDNNKREIFIFREGSIVFWNVPKVECDSFLKFIKNFEMSPYKEEIVLQENEEMNFDYVENVKTKLINGMMLINEMEESSHLEKYAFSNAIALSVKLSIWEASLDRYIDSIEFVSEDMQMGRKIKLNRNQVFRKTGELFALRHKISLSSDLLDAPDFYWDRDELEKLFLNTCGYLNVNKRTKIMNEKLSHCVELMELLASHLNDEHHVRLEWMIIILIMVEVVFECIHYADRFLVDKPE